MTLTILILMCCALLSSAPDAKPTSLPFSSLKADDLGFEHLEYTIPKDAVRVGPFGMRSSGLRTRKRAYYLYNHPKTGDRVAREVYVFDTVKKTKTRVELKLYRNKLLHGVERTWFDNGRPKSASPWKKWIMHGTFKHWDEKGNLVGCYRIINGRGVKRVYYSNGQLFREIPHQFNRQHGPIRTFYKNGQMWTISRKRHHEFFGMSVSFLPDGRFRNRAWSDSKGKIHGPVVESDTANEAKPLNIRYFLHGSEVSEDQYAKAAQKDNTLRKLPADPDEFRKIGKKTKEIIAKYKKLKRVKIPLKELPDRP